MQMRQLANALVTRTIAVTLAFGILALAAERAIADGALRLLTWEGYADPEWIDEFEATNGVTVTRTYVGSNDEYMAKLAAGGGDYDLVVIVSSLAQRAIDAGFVEPVDIDKIGNFNQLFPDFQALDFVQKDGKIYGVPTFWAPQPVTVNAEVIPDRSDFDIIYDEEYAGKIAIWADVSTLGEVAAHMGYEDIWNLSDDDLEAVKQKMIDQKPLVRTYFENAGTAVDLFLSGEIVIATGWSYVTDVLIKQGFPAREFVPDHATAWLDSHFIVAGTTNRELAHKFIDHMISAKAQGAIAENAGWGITNQEAETHVSPEVWKRLHMDEAAAFLANLNFWQDIPRRGKYLEILNEIKAAE